MSDNNSSSSNNINNNGDNQRQSNKCPLSGKEPLSSSLPSSLPPLPTTNGSEDLQKQFALFQQQQQQQTNLPPNFRSMLPQFAPVGNDNPYLNIPYNYNNVPGFTNGTYGPNINNANNIGNPYGTNPLSTVLRGKKSSPYDPQLHGVITKLADEKVRKTFGSIEMVLDAFSSISMILESTYSALDGSLRTITGMADHLIFVRNHLAQIALFPRLAQAVYDFFRWLLKLLGFGKLISNSVSGFNESAWNEALINNGDQPSTIKDLLNSESDPNRSSLMPIVVFFSLILGTPYVMWRILGAQGRLPTTNLPEWTLAKGKHFTATTLTDFKGRNSNELSFSKNQKLFIKPESVQPDAKWLIASTTTGKDIPKIGYVPVNFIKLQFV